jgi:putative ABC transport system ATP-binding protein
MRSVRLLRPDSGSVVVEGVDIWSLNPDQLANFRLNKVGFVFQDYHLFPRLSTAENVAIPLILKRKDWDESIAEAIRYLDIVGLKGRAELPPVKLSGGEQQRVAIARAMAGQPDILIMDEPTASLDGDTGHAIVSFVRANVLNANRCIIVVTHDSRIYELASRILQMEDGHLTGTMKWKQ